MAQRVPLNDSQKALSVGLPGLEKKAVGGALVLTAMHGNGARVFAQYAINLGSDPASQGTNRLLFFDDWPLDRRGHVERYIGQSIVASGRSLRGSAPECYLGIS
jgi:hypothetical protein